MNITPHNNINFKGAFYTKATDKNIEFFQAAAAKSKQASIYDFLPTKFHNKGEKTYLIVTQKEGQYLDEFYEESYYKKFPLDAEAKAFKKAVNGDVDIFLNFVDKHTKHIKENLQNFFPTDVEKFPTIPFSKVKNAIEKGKFDFKKCKIEE